MTKICSACNKPLDVSLFGKYARSKDGLKPHCKKCAKLSHAKYYELNRDSVVKKILEWQAAHPEQLKSYKQKHYLGGADNKV